MYCQLRLCESTNKPTCINCRTAYEGTFRDNERMVCQEFPFLIGNIIDFIVSPLVSQHKKYCPACEEVRQKFNLVPPWQVLYSPNLLLDCASLMRGSSGAWWIWIVPLIYAASVLSSCVVGPIRFVGFCRRWYLRRKG